MDKNVLTHNCKVTNTDRSDYLFQIGGHPAFACPFMENESSNDYYLEFSENETVNQKIIDVEHKGMSDITLPFLDNEKDFVRQQLFDNDAVCFKGREIKNIIIDH